MEEVDRFQWKRLIHFAGNRVPKSGPKLVPAGAHLLKNVMFGKPCAARQNVPISPEEVVQILLEEVVQKYRIRLFQSDHGRCSNLIQFGRRKTIRIWSEFRPLRGPTNCIQDVSLE